jgi:hypothetical protein
MKDIQPWISVIIGIGYMIFKIMNVIGKHKSVPTYKPDAEEEIEEESLTDWEEIKQSIKKIPTITTYEKEVAPPRSKINRTFNFTNKNSKLINTPSYPGINKLLLPTQEQNPYKLYKMVSPRHPNKLNQLLNKHPTSRKAIIMSEVLKRKP